MFSACLLFGLVWFGLWCLTPRSTIFRLYRGGQFYCWKKPEYPEKTTELTNFITYCCTIKETQILVDQKDPFV